MNTRMFTEFKEYCLDFLYPRRCAICGQIASPKGNLVCVQCAPRLRPIEEPKCKCCGKAIENMEQEYCSDCKKRTYYFEYGFALWNYDKVMRKSIADFKYHHRREYAEFYGEQFVEKYGQQLLALQLDAIIPVPVHWTRYIERGYNQAQVVAEQIGSRTGIPVLGDVLLRKKRTVAQKNLNDKERFRNLEHAFSVTDKWKNSGEILKRVLLIDDIYTTGSTLSMCAKVLRQAGITEVYFGVLCIGFGY